jgi:16S rRNA (adenine1518-N6/adenine1519-N6)-dimethyltransferase
MGARLGQHFLASEGYRKRILDALHLTGCETVLEIGPGKGALTDMLAERAARLVAVEIDPLLAAQMKARYAENPRVEIVQGDILTVPLEGLAANREADFARMSPAPVRVLGNLPYYITSPILLRLFGHARLFDEIVVMVQQEVAERLAAKPGTRDYGLLTVTAAYYTSAAKPPKLLFTIPPGAFHPPPRVYSAVVGMRVAPRNIEGEAGFFHMAKASFAQKRKTLVNNLKPLYGVDQVRVALGEIKLPPAARAEELPVEKLIELFLALGSPAPSGAIQATSASRFAGPGSRR